MVATVTLYRPIGEKELILIMESDFKKFPPRLEWQPIFYPVLNEEYAAEIASQWNTKDEFGNYLGFVTKFEVAKQEFDKYEVKNVGGSIHDELWVSAEELDNFNKAIQGDIEIVHVFIGEEFKEVSNAKVKDVINKIVDDLDYQCRIHESRLEHFLKTKSREILPFSYFEQPFEQSEELSEEEQEKAQEEFFKLKDQVRKINTVNEAIDFLLDKAFSNEQIDKIKNETPYVHLKVMSKHFGINMYLRNLFFHGNKNELFKKSVQAQGQILSVNPGELGEGILEDALWRRLHQCEMHQIKNKDAFDKLKQIEKERIEQFFKDRGLERSKLTAEDWDGLWDDWQAYFKRSNLLQMAKKMKWMSYNLALESIEALIQLDKELDKEPEERMHLYREKDRILAEVTEEEMPTYIELRDTYLKSSELMDEPMRKYKNKRDLFDEY